MNNVLAQTLSRYRGNREKSSYGLIIKKFIIQSISKNYLFLIVDWRNIHLWRKMVCAKRIAYITYNF